MIKFLTKRDMNICHLFFGVFAYRLLLEGFYISAALTFVAGVAICVLLDKLAARAVA